VSPISNDRELGDAAAEASGLLQEIQDYLGKQHMEAGEVRFPRGYIRTAEEGRRRVAFIRDYTLRTNLSYTLMLSDVYSWILRRTDLAATAREMVIKAALFLGGSIAESILVGYYTGVLGRNQKYKKRTARLVSDGIVSEKVKHDLDWLWDMRNRQHLFLAEAREIDHYGNEDYLRAAVALRALVDGLTAHSARRS
jgi:hypothetical protein